jgi:hypothetical protein
MKFNFPHKISRRTRHVFFKFSFKRKTVEIFLLFQVVGEFVHIKSNLKGKLCSGRAKECFSYQIISLKRGTLSCGKLLNSFRKVFVSSGI